MSASFADRLAGAVSERQSNLCLGLDPPARLYAEAADAGEAGDLVANWSRRLLDACAQQCVAVKPQLACFERLGAAGAAALAAVASAARDRGLLVIADGKRGDVPHSATAYAESLCGSAPAAPGSLGADAFTANPLPGADSIDALIEVAERSRAGIFVLVRMSNPGATDFFDRRLAGGGTLADAIAALVADRAARLTGDSGLSGVGAVVGATAPDHLGRLREAMPDSIFLMPGVGAQGGEPRELSAGVGGGPASVIFPVSRGIAEAAEPSGAAARLRDALWRATST